MTRRLGYVPLRVSLVLVVLTSIVLTSRSVPASTCSECTYMEEWRQLYWDLVPRPCDPGADGGLYAPTPPDGGSGIYWEWSWHKCSDHSYDAGWHPYPHECPCGGSKEDCEATNPPPMYFGTYDTYIGCDVEGNERCDGCNNDFPSDFEIDEGCGCCPGEARPCGTLGECAGTERCEGDFASSWGACDAPQSEPQTEDPCDGLDNDCDGEVDEGGGPSCACSGGPDGPAPASSDPPPSVPGGEASITGPTAPSATSPGDCESTEAGATCVGKPVDLRTGWVETNAETDLVLNDPLFPLKMERRWSTARAIHQYGKGETQAPLGYGWSHSF